MSDLNTINGRLDAVQEIIGEEDMFYGIQNGLLQCLSRLISALKGFQDFDRLLTSVWVFHELSDLSLSPYPTPVLLRRKESIPLSCSSISLRRLHPSSSLCRGVVRRYWYRFEMYITALFSFR
jgi:hypothetical protein